MPGIADHDRRRLEVAEAASGLVARQGLEPMTLGDVPAQAGFSHGALKPYFPARANLLQTPVTGVFKWTNGRISSAATHLPGMAAVRAFAREVLPLGGIRLGEARVVVPFWRAAIHNAEVLDGKANTPLQLEERLDAHLRLVGAWKGTAQGSIECQG